MLKTSPRVGRGVEMSLFLILTDHVCRWAEGRLSPPVITWITSGFPGFALRVESPLRSMNLHGRWMSPWGVWATIRNLTGLRKLGSGKSHSAVSRTAVENVIVISYGKPVLRSVIGIEMPE